MFRTPSQLAEAFNSSDSAVRYAADMAHKTVVHLHRGYASYFPYGKSLGIRCDNLGTKREEIC